MSKGDRDRLADCGAICTAAAMLRFDVQSSVRHRILDLAPRGQPLSRKLQEWWALDFAAFREEAKRLYRAEISIKERAEWEDYLRKNGEKVRALTAEIEAAERQIDLIIYGLFDLAPDEIKLLESSIAGGYGSK
jgi:hypothetical protein